MYNHPITGNSARGASFCAKEGYNFAIVVSANLIGIQPPKNKRSLRLSIIIIGNMFFLFLASFCYFSKPLLEPFSAAALG